MSEAALIRKTIPNDASDAQIASALRLVACCGNSIDFTMTQETARRLASALEADLPSKGTPALSALRMDHQQGFAFFVGAMFGFVLTLLNLWVAR